MIKEIEKVEEIIEYYAEEIQKNRKTWWQC